MNKKKEELQSERDWNFVGDGIYQHTRTLKYTFSNEAEQFEGEYDTLEETEEARKKYGEFLDKGIV